jgi:hypothetical protein
MNIEEFAIGKEGWFDELYLRTLEEMAQSMYGKSYSALGEARHLTSNGFVNVQIRLEALARVFVLCIFQAALSDMIRSLNMDIRRKYL